MGYAGEQCMGAGGDVAGIYIESIDGTTAMLGQADVVGATYVIAAARFVLHALGDFADRQVQSAARGVEADALHLAELGGAAQHGAIAAGFVVACGGDLARMRPGNLARPVRVSHKVVPSECEGRAAAYTGCPNRARIRSATRNAFA